MKLPRLLSCSSCCGTGPRILGMLAMTASFMLVELIVGHLTNSMALVADSFHMFSDVVALVIALVSVRFVIFILQQRLYSDCVQIELKEV